MSETERANGGRLYDSEELRKLSAELLRARVTGGVPVSLLPIEDHRDHLAWVFLTSDWLAERLARAWDEGHKQGGPMHDVNYDDPDAHTRNPYRAVQIEATR